MTDRKKKVLYIALAVLVLLAVLFAVDTLAVTNGKKPVFARCFFGADDGGSGKYIGPGYWFDIKGNFMPDPAPGSPEGVTEAEGRVLGIPYLRRER